MKIAVVNASFQKGESASRLLLTKYKNTNEGFTYEVLTMAEEEKALDLCRKINACDAIVFCAPLYNGTFAADVIRTLSEAQYMVKKNMPFVCILHCEYPEGSQTKIAMETMKNWAEKAGISWRMGIGIGESDAIFTMRKFRAGFGPLHKLGKAYVASAKGIREGKQEDMYIELGMPRILYTHRLEERFKESAKAQGLKMSDISKKDE